jgi:hypothetical protein
MGARIGYNRAVRKAALPLVVLLAAASCKPSETAQKKFEAAARSQSCVGKVPAEWVSTWPIPLKDGGYAVLFYALDRKAKTNDGLPRVRPTAPLATARLDEGLAVKECATREGKPQALEAERYSPAAMALEEEPFDAATAKLLELTRKAGAAFAKDEKAPELAKEYWAQFQLLGEPALRPHYYRASPAFWEWLRRENGASLPAAK